MGKHNDEIASEIVQALLQARATVISSMNVKADFFERYLSDEAAAEAYKTVLKAVNDPYDSHQE